MSFAPIDSVSAVQARINMHTAFQKELAGRLPALTKLESLSAQLREMGCAPSKLASQAERVGELRGKVAALETQGAEYKAALDDELRRQLQLDEMRLAFAERAEALRLWQEETIDTLGEVVVVDSVGEAEQQLGELQSGVGALLGEKRAELDALSGFAAQMAAAGITKNPYSRHSIDELEGEMAELDAELAARKQRLEAALGHQRELEALKKKFAGAAEGVLAFAAEQKAALEADAPAITITADDKAAAERGRAMIHLLKERQTDEAKAARTATLSAAADLAEELLAQGELHNPFTKETVPSLKSTLNQLDKMLKDRQLFLEGQLARAEVSISTEQHAELLAAFKHFDKDKSGGLDEKEFVAALQSIDVGMSQKDMTDAFTRFATTQEAVHGGEPCIGEEAYITCVLAYLADNDTSDSLVDSFRQMAMGKEWLTEDDIHSVMGEAEAAQLLEALAPYDSEQGYDYSAFVRTVYGSGKK